MKTPRRRLTDILRADDHKHLTSAWEATEAAEEFKPLPSGGYNSEIERGELITSRTNNTPGYQLTHRVLDGDHAGRRFWHEIWLTEAALAMAKRDLAKLGVESIEQLDLPLPLGIRCRVKLVLRTDDDGNEFNRVKLFEVTGVEPPEADPFGPRAPEPSPPPIDGQAADHQAATVEPTESAA